MRPIFVAVLVLLSIAARPAGGTCTAAFESPVLYPIGVTYPTQLVVANFNGDGFPDAIVVGRGGVADAVEVLPGLHSGGFGPPERIVLAEGEVQLVAADFDRNGFDDLAMVDFEYPRTTTLLYFRNDRGTLDTPVRIPLPDQAGVVVGDFNGDGHLDLAVPGGPQTLMLHGDGTGSFSTRTYASPDGAVMGAGGVAADLDRDGSDDLYSNRTIYFGSASGVFREHRKVSETTGMRPVILDLDHDGRLDVASVRDTNRIHVIYDVAGDPRNVAMTMVEKPNFPIMALAAGDLVGDGTDTLVGATSQGGIAAFGRHYMAQGKTDGKVLALGDVTRDGRVDVLTATQDTLVMIPNAGGGRLLSPVDVSEAWGSADFNGDGLMDLFSSQIRVQNPDGSFRITASALLQAGQLIEVLLGDINRDGHLDLVYLVNANGSYVSLTAAAGKGDGTFTFTYLTKGGSLPYLGQRPSLVDIDGDGFLDVLALINDTSTHLSVARGGADGRFTAWDRLPMLAFTMTADIDADGDADILGTRSVWFNDGAGRFSERPRMVAAELVPDAVDDLDGDGFPDLVSAESVPTGDSMQTYLVIARGDGLGEFHRSGSIPIPGWSRPMFGDFNGDGRRDILVAGQQIFGDGKGGLVAGPEYLHWWYTRFFGPVSIADFNRDGRDDIIDGRFVRLSGCFQPQPKRRAVRR